MKIKFFEDQFSKNIQKGFIFEPHSSFKVARNKLELGGINSYRNDAIAKIESKELKNLEIEVDFKMVDDNKNGMNWFGIKLRSTDNTLTDGYLIYIRSNGNVAIYTAGKDLPKAQFQLTNSILNKRIKLKISVVGSQFIISADGNEISYTDNNNRLLRKGNIYLYVNYTKNYVYSVKIWNKIKIISLFKNKFFLGLLSILIILLVIMVIYYYKPDLIEKINNDPRFIMWSNIK